MSMGGQLGETKECLPWFWRREILTVARVEGCAGQR